MKQAIDFIINAGAFDRLITSLRTSLCGVNSRIGPKEITHSYDSMMFFVELHMSDKRDFSTYRSGDSKKFTKFGHKVHNFAKRILGLVKQDKECYIPSSAAVEIVKDLARRLWLALDTDLSLTLYELSLIDDDVSWKMILSASVNPNAIHYTGNSDLFMRDYQAISFIRKYEGFDFGDDRAWTSLQRWIDCENQCAETNFILRNAHLYLSHKERADVYAVRQVIQRILGASPSLTEITEFARLGPGATTSCPSKYCSVFDKIDQEWLDVTPRCYDLANFLIKKEPWSDVMVGKLRKRNSGPLTFISKKWDELRPIEPPIDANMPLQLGLATWLRRLMKQFGLDLDHQALKNALLALQGSCDDSIVTRDIRSASDTIAYEAIKKTFPPSWFNLMDQMRTTHVVINHPDSDKSESREVKLHKMSAMGNGFTFEMESLLFLAILLVACKRNHERKLPDDIGVFGDDLCYPREYDSEVKHLLSLFGFQSNEQKTFATGPFRESCGKDYFKGAPVRPFFLKEKLQHVQNLYVLANGIRRASVRSMHYYASDIRYRSVWDAIVQLIPDKYKVFGPSTLGDTVIWGNPEDGVPGEWPVHRDSIWSYRKGCEPLFGIQRGLNIRAYLNSSPTAAWQLVKSGFVKKAFQKDLYLFDRPVVFDKTILDRMPEEASTVPLIYRKVSQYRLRFGRSDRTVSIQCDCPPFR